MQSSSMHFNLRTSIHSRCMQPLRSARQCRTQIRSIPSAAARDQTETVKKPQPGDGSKDRRGGLGDLLGPIGLTLGGRIGKGDSDSKDKQARENNGRNGSSRSGDGAGQSNRVELGPIALSFAEDRDSRLSRSEDEAAPSGEKPRSIHTMTTEEWRAKFEADGAVDLWVEEEFNAGSRLIGGRDTHRGKAPGFGSGEGPSAGAVQKHTVRIHNPAAGQELEVEVPEDRYILWEAEDQGLLLPWACRMGCCTACAVKVLEGEVHQPQALGVSRGLREQGYALMCISYPRSDAVLQCIEEDELYDKQFGEAFAAQALDPNDRRNILRDDYALEIADMDE